MKQILITFLIILTLVVDHPLYGQEKISFLTAPAGKLPVTINPDGISVIPNGRLISPAGKTISVAPHPYGLAISHDGNIAITANSGVNPISVTIIRNLKNKNPEVMQIPPGVNTDKGILASVFMGLAVSPGDSMLYVAGGQENIIHIFNLKTGEKISQIDCRSGLDNQNFSDGYIGDLVLSKDGNTLYAVDQIQFRLLIIDTRFRQLIKSVRVGRYPFGIALSPDQKKIFVANVGMYEYKPIQSKDSAFKGIEFPASAFGSKQAHDGYVIDSLIIPGLGDPNVPESFSVWAVDVSTPMNAKVIAKIKTGYLVGSLVEGIPAVGGSSPNSLVAGNDYAFVSNGNNDNISVIDIHTSTIISEIALKPFEEVKHFRGVIPFGLALSPDQKRLYVAESGINAIGVIDIPTMKVIGHIPSGWFPSKLRVTDDGKYLVIANAKGFGSGPNGGKDFTPPPEGTYIGCLMKGTVQYLEIPSDDELKAMTETVLKNNFKVNYTDELALNWRKTNPVPLYGGGKNSPVKHIVFISKENRTFDEVFGGLEGVDGDKSLARYGENVSFTNRSKTSTVENTTVMPNHLKLAREFAISENFYVDSDVSADGHRWLVNTYPNEWVETCTAASYGGNRNYKPNSEAPGIYAMNGAAGAIYPEDYNEAGSMWDHLERNHTDFFNFGFGIMFEPATYHESFKYTGIRHLVNYPVPQPMFDKTSKKYPTYNMAIPDQFRADQFIREFREKWIDGKELLPQVLTVILPNDHGAGERPDAGYPFRESYMADNDLALGRIVEFLSNTPYWKEMAIVVTEDDAQNGVDHVDAHRSILMVISPWAKKNHIGHEHYSFGSIFKTFWNILGLPYLNQYDAGATDLADLFTGQPDFRPYQAVPVDIRIFDPQKALDPFDEHFNWKALEESPVIDDPEEMKKEQDEFRLENREKK